MQCGAEEERKTDGQTRVSHSQPVENMARMLKSAMVATLLKKNSFEVTRLMVVTF